MRGRCQWLSLMLKREGIYQKHVSSIPADNQHKLSKKLDFEHEGSDVHLEKVADTMINWREAFTKENDNS